MTQRLKFTLLAVIGIAIASLSVLAYRHPDSLSCVLQKVGMGKATLASAGCTAHTQAQDDVFFVSCGGIY